MSQSDIQWDGIHICGGRAAVVNCERIRVVESIPAELRGDKAKLVWVVSLDGKKTQSETYKVLAVLDKRKSPSTCHQLNRRRLLVPIF
jgi:hypothetical protein